MEESVSLPQLPKGWGWTNLGELVETSKERVDPAELQEAKYIGLEHIEKDTGKLVGFGSSGDVRSTKTRFHPGELLYGRLRPYLNKVFVAGFDGVCSTDILVFPTYDHVSNRFLLYRLLSNDFVRYASQNVSGVQHPRVGFTTLSRFELALPPIAEQNRIAFKIEELFTNLDAGVESLKKVKAQLKRYRQAVLKYAFEGKLTEEWRKTHKDQIEPAQILLERIKQERKGLRDAYMISSPLETFDLPKLPETWTWATIRELETFIGSGITPRGGRKVYVNEGIPFIRSQNVHPDGLRLKGIAHITPQIHEEMKRTQTRPNDVLLNITGASIGRSTYIPTDLVEANVNQHVCIIRTGWWIVPAYLSHFLNSTSGQDQIFSTQWGVTRQGFNYAQVRSLRIPLAPPPEQKEIVERIGQAYSVSYEIEENIELDMKRTERLRQSILKRAFEGKLVPQDPTDEPAEKLLTRIKEERRKHELDTKSDKKNILRQMELVRYVK